MRSKSLYWAKLDVPVYLTRRIRLKPPDSYFLYATVRGEPHPVTGMVVNLQDLKRALQDQAGLVMDKKLPTGTNRAASAIPPERLAALLWEELQPAIRSGRLHRIRCCEGEDSYADYYGEARGVIYVTRRYRFCASHRLYTAALSEEENARIYGKCSYASGHGHNYVLEVTAAGQLDSVTGRAIDGAALDRLVNERILSRFDHRNLNCDLPEFQDRGRVPTGENICKVVWNLLTDCDRFSLHRVKLIETENHSFEYYGDRPDVY